MSLEQINEKNKESEKGGSEKDEQAVAETWKQEQAPWEDFEENSIDENFERRSPDQEEEKKMNESLKSLGNIFEGSDINWHLDGAMNISLMNKGSDEEQVDYIGVHKDVDISVEKEELEKLEEQLKEKGYGLFLSETEVDENGEKSKVLRRIGYSQFKESENAHPIIMAMDEQGNVHQEEDLNGIDVHIIERNEQGDPLGYSGVTVSEEWMQPQPMTFQGEQINLSHPAKVLYYKLHQNRGYDTTDVKYLLETDTLQEKDLENMEKVFQEEFQANKSRVTEVFREVSSEINENMNKKEIFKAMLKQPELKTRSEQGMEAGLKSLAEKIAESNDKSTESILEQAYKLFQIEEKNNEKMQEISRMKQQIKDKEKLEEARAELKEYQSQEQEKKEPKVDQNY